MVVEKNYLMLKIAVHILEVKKMQLFERLK